MSEEIGTQRVVGMLHYYLDLPRRDLTGIVETFAKAQRQADKLRTIKI